MYVVHSDDRGNTFSEASKLGSGSWKLDACPMDEGSITIREGAVVAAWRRDGTVYRSTIGGPEMPLGPGKQPVVLSESFKSNGGADQRQMREPLKGVAQEISAVWTDLLGKHHNIARPLRHLAKQPVCALQPPLQNKNLHQPESTNRKGSFGLPSLSSVRYRYSSPLRSCYLALSIAN